MHAVAPWDVHSCKHDCPGARERCERGAVARPVGERPDASDQTAPCPPRLAVLRLTTYVYVLSICWPAPLRWIQGYCSTPPQTVRQAKPRYGRAYPCTPRDDTIPRHPFAFLSLVRYRRMSSIAESADPARLACGGIAPKRTLWPLWTAGRSLTPHAASPRDRSIAVSRPILVNERLRSLGRFQT